MEVPFDVVEQILIRSEVEDLIRCKSVCKSWQSLISSPRFVQAHLKYTYNNDRDNQELGHRRMATQDIVNEESWFYCNFFHIVGSCNGLVCLSPKDVDFLVINPSTGEERKLKTPRYQPQWKKIGFLRQVICWGFGYDPSIDDYKVIAGFRRNLDIKRTRFHALTLKSNTWKVIGEVEYRSIEGKSGILCAGAIHWFMLGKNKKKVIMSVDLSTHQLKEIPQPEDLLLYHIDIDHRLGVIDECLCIYSMSSPFSSNKWLFKNNKWELYHHCQSKYDIAHRLAYGMGPPTFMYSDNDAEHVPSAGNYIRASIFVKSLVSPHQGQPKEQGNNIRKRKRKRNKRS